MTPGRAGDASGPPSAESVARRFAGDAFWAFVFNFSAAGLSILSSGIVSRLLGVRGFAAYALVLFAVSAMYTVFFSWITAASVRFGRIELVSHGTVGTTATMHSVAALAIYAVLCLAVVLGEAPADRFFTVAGGGRMAVLFLLFYLLLEHLVTLLQAGRVMRRTSLLYVVEKATALLLLAPFFFVAGAAAWWQVLGVVAFCRFLACALGVRWLLPVARRPRWRPTAVREAMLWSWPNVCLGVIAILMRDGNLVLMRLLGDLGDVGLLAAGLYVMQFIGIFGTTINTMLIPHLVEILARGRRERLAPFFERLVPWALFGTSAVVCLLAVLAPWYTPLVFGAEFAPVGAPAGVLVLGLALVLGTTLWSALISASDDLRPLLLPSLVGGVWNLAAGFLFIRAWGLWGAAAATAGGYLIQGLLFRRPALRKIAVASPCDAWALFPPAAAFLLLTTLPPRWAAPLYLPLVVAFALILHLRRPLRAEDLRLAGEAGFPVGRRFGRRNGGF